MMSAEFSAKDVARVTKRLQKFQGVGLEQRLTKGAQQAGSMLVPYIRAETPVGPSRDPKPGYLRDSVASRPAKTSGLGGGNVLTWLAAYVGPKAPHRHLIIRGHRIVTPGKRDTGRKTTPNPFVDRGIGSHIQEAMKIVSKVLFAP